MNIIDILRGTPLWVYAIFAYILFIGIRATKPQKTSFYKMLILPIVFLFLTLYKKYNLELSHLLIYAVALIIGILIGWILTSKLKITVDKTTKMVSMPGTYSVLILSLAFFVIKYYVGFTYATDPIQKTNILLYGLDQVASGLITGRFIGRVIYLYKKLF